MASKLCIMPGMPAFGFGTWDLKEENASIIRHAILQGVRHFDCASIYLNELLVGRVLKECIDEGLVTREELFITTKLWNTCHEHVEESLRMSLKELQLDYVDLFLIHWPSPKQFTGLPIHSVDPKIVEVPAKVGLHKVWADMERMVDLGLTKRIGVSNFHLSQVVDMVNYARIPPACNQIELHPWNSRFEHVEHAKKLGVYIVAFSPLGAGRSGVVTDPVIKEIATHHNVDPAVIILNWAVAKGVSVIPRTTDPKRLISNSTYLQLTDEEVARIDALNKNEPTTNAYAPAILGYNMQNPLSVL